MENIKSVDLLIASYKNLPGVGNKTAERLAYATLEFSKEDIDAFIYALNSVKDNVHKCDRCGMYIDTPYCPICDNPNRSNDLLMVLTSYKSVLSFEKTNKYFGKYYILKGAISPIKGITYKDVGIDKLYEYALKNGIKEIIVACDSTLEGEITAQYIYKQFENDSNIKISRLAFGLPIGADLEYVDSKTIELSLSGRKIVKGE